MKYPQPAPAATAKYNAAYGGNLSLESEAILAANFDGEDSQAALTMKVVDIMRRDGAIVTIKDVTWATVDSAAEVTIHHHGFELDMRVAWVDGGRVVLKVVNSGEREFEMYDVDTTQQPSAPACDDFEPTQPAPRQIGRPSLAEERKARRDRIVVTCLTIGFWLFVAGLFFVL